MRLGRVRASQRLDGADAKTPSGQRRLRDVLVAAPRPTKVRSYRAPEERHGEHEVNRGDDLWIPGQGEKFGDAACGSLVGRRQVGPCWDSVALELASLRHRSVRIESALRRHDDRAGLHLATGPGGTCCGHPCEQEGVHDVVEVRLKVATCTARHSPVHVPLPQVIREALGQRLSREDERSLNRWKPAELVSRRRRQATDRTSCQCPDQELAGRVERVRNELGHRAAADDAQG